MTALRHPCRTSVSKARFAKMCLEAAARTHLLPPSRPSSHFAPYADTIRLHASVAVQPFLYRCLVIILSKSANCRAPTGQLFRQPDTGMALLTLLPLPFHPKGYLPAWAALHAHRLPERFSAPSASLHPSNATPAHIKVR